MLKITLPPKVLTPLEQIEKLKAEVGSLKADVTELKAKTAALEKAPEKAKGVG